MTIHEIYYAYLYEKLTAHDALKALIHLGVLPGNAMITVRAWGNVRRLRKETDRVIAEAQKGQCPNENLPV